MHVSETTSRRAVRSTARIPLSVHLAAAALVTLGALAMLTVLSLPGGLGTGVGVLLIVAATLLVTGANWRHGRASRRALSFDLPSALLLLLVVTWSLAVVLFPHDAPVVLRAAVGLGFGGVFLVAVRWEDRILTRHAVQERSAPANA